MSCQVDLAVAHTCPCMDQCSREIVELESSTATMPLLPEVLSRQTSAKCWIAAKMGINTSPTSTFIKGTVIKSKALENFCGDRVQENTFSRFVESFKKQFAERELESLLARTKVRDNSSTPRCICMVACTQNGDPEVLGTLDLRPPAAATGVPPPSIPEACAFSPACLESYSEEPHTNPCFLDIFDMMFIRQLHS